MVVLVKMAELSMEDANSSFSVVDSDLLQQFCDPGKLLRILAATNPLINIIYEI